jgi:two-component sensor histidine kinase
MNKSFLKNINKTALVVSVGIVAMLLFSLIFLWVGDSNSTQASPPIIIDIFFEGEYKIGDGEWHKVVPGEHISSTKGDVTLRGIFQMINPENGETLGPLHANLPVHLYLNHIGGYAVLPGGGKLMFDTEHELFGEDACAVMWGAVPSMGAEPITIVLHNPHRFGNENAIDELLENLSAAEGIYLETMMLEKGAPQRNIGLLIFITALIILGIAAFSTVIHLNSVEMWLIGLMSLSAGGYLLFDAFAVSFWQDSNIVNTRMLGLCMMFYMLFGTMLIVTLLKGKAKAVAFTATLVSAITILACISLSIFDKIPFFDTWIGWAVIEILIGIILAVCVIVSIRGSSPTKRNLYITSLAFLVSFPIDVVATACGWWEGGLVAKFVFFAIFIMALVVVLLVIPSNINAAARARQLEAEQQILKRELQENRISIMLSQMKPHFIFNTLNTIYHLCDIDPEKAKSTISSFSTYLRNNINNLEQSEMIFFEKELSFVNAYLDIEKVRFDDELIISFDIAASNFKLPVLTVQPIVENAVKHGTSKKEGVSHLYISTSESDHYFEVKIRDTGVGFDINQTKNDGRNHVGITNVRQRLQTLCNGTLTIESTPGVGTTAIVRIPKKEASSK